MKTLLLLALISIPLTGAAQTKQENWQSLNRMNQRFENYRIDFAQVGKTKHAARSRNEEDLTDLGLTIVADQVVAHLESVEALITVYLKVLNKQDRIAIWPLITEQIANTSNRLERQVEVINVEMTALKTPAMITEAMRMRDDLRKVIENLAGAQKELEQAEFSIP